jgi:ABC-type amino acid transport substrate-binding protein
MNNRILAACVLIACSSAIQGRAAMTGELEKIRSSGEIILAHREASIPFSYFDSDKKAIGYSVDLCLKVVEAVRKELKLPALKVTFMPVTSASRIPVIAERKASLECGSTTNTRERRQQVDYSIAHFISASRLLVKTASGIERIEALAGKKVSSTKGTTNIRTLARLNEELGLRMQIVEAKDHAEAFAMVESGAVDAFAMDDVLLYGLRANSADARQFTVVGKPMTIEPYAIMLPKGDAAFKKVVDGEVRRVMLSGDIHTLYKKWFMSPIAPKGINLDLPMPFLLKEAIKYPSDKVGDLN